ncbi:MAG: MBL fold metallo-hydrolase [Candidatus Pacebacteria bacterium]|nr:MBL fold metallo-hydrolase [Candidatus Paceibacterota bacterium]
MDYLVLESVYGDRNHEDKMESVNRFKSIIMKAIKDNGVILVPAFSIERTQELLFYIHDMVLRGEMPKIPIYLDSPLAIKITSIYRKYFKYLNTKSKDFILNGEDIFNFPNLYQTLNKEESKAIANIHGCKMIIAGSGMSTGGRIIHHEKSYLGLKTTNLILVGYQSIGSLGRLLQEGIKNIKIQNQDIIVRAHIESIGGFSAHKDSKHLVQYVKDNSNNLKKVFVVLGEPKSEIFLAQRIREYVGVEALTQKENEIIEIEV